MTLSDYWHNFTALQERVRTAEVDAERLAEALADYELEHRTRHIVCDENSLYQDGIGNARAALALHRERRRKRDLHPFDLDAMPDEG